MKIKFTKDLRGRQINQKVSPVKITLEDLLHRLDAIDWNFDKLSIYAKKVYESYKLNRLLGEIIYANVNTRKELVRKNLLSLYGTEIGDNCLAIYIVAYSAHKYPNLTVSMAVKRYLEDEKIERNSYRIRSIVTVGLYDGMFLNILDKKGIAKDESFLNKWLYAHTDNVFDEIIDKIDNNDNDIITNRFLIFNTIQEKKLNFQISLKEDIIKQQKNVRHIYKINSTNEKIALKYLKKRLDLELDIKYANRNCITRELFQIMENINRLGDFTIYRFDFKHFFESVDAKKVFDTYIVNTNLQRYEKELLEQLIENCDHCFAGLPTSNALVEIIASKFDQVLKSRFSNDGLFFYSRYVDDGILIFNEYVDELYIKCILDETIEEVFDMPSVKQNMDKMRYLTKDTGACEFDYLGYKFEKKRNNFLFGIADSKIKKFENRLDCIILQYKKDNNIELFRHRLLYYISRIVFYINTNSRFSAYGNWNVYGIIENYSLLRKYIKKRNKLIENTKSFLYNGVFSKCCHAELTNKRMPYFLRGNGKNSYSVAYGLERNKTIIFHPNIGWSTEYLKAQITKLNPGINLRRKSYRELSMIYYDIINI